MNIHTLIKGSKNCKKIFSLPSLLRIVKWLATIHVPWKKNHRPSNPVPNLKQRTREENNLKKQYRNVSVATCQLTSVPVGGQMSRPWAQMWPDVARRGVMTTINARTVSNVWHLYLTTGYCVYKGCFDYILGIIGFHFKMDRAEL